MKIVLASDCHGEEGSLRQILLREQDADRYLFLGDSQLPPESLSPFASVKGNCDHFLDYPLQMTIETPAGLLYASHYPPGQNKALDDLFSLGIRIYCHGHTHVRRYEHIGGVTVVCPGSTDLPRDAKAGYAVLTLNGPGDIDCEFKDL